MGIVFVISLLLAWPTSGLSLLALPAFAVIRGYLRGKAGRTKDAHRTAERQAIQLIRNGDLEHPTWIRNPAYQKQLVIETSKAAIEAGMTSIEAESWLNRQDVANAIMTAAASFEKGGFGKFEQIVLVSDFTKNLAREQLTEKNTEVVPVRVAPKPATQPSSPVAAVPDEDGRTLFEAGVAMASQYRCQEAIEYYTRSIKASENPAPYINRANLLSKRIRHFEAMHDLLDAQRLDSSQGNEFSTQISRELKNAQMLTENYRNGKREKLVMAFDDGDTKGVELAILLSSFEIDPLAWDENSFDIHLIEYHFFNEIDNVVKFEEMANYPEVADWVNEYPKEFVLKKVNACPDLDAYREAEVELHMRLCCFHEHDMHLLRRGMLYEIHCNLMARDFGDFWNSFKSNCRGLTKEAEDFIAATQA